MSARTKIEWTRDADGTPGSSWNPVSGCSKTSAGCKFCYAERIFPRAYGWERVTVTLKEHLQQAHGIESVTVAREFKHVKCHPDRLERPLRWRAPRRIFVNSMSDLFHEDVPEDFIDKVFAVMASAPRHTFLVLTKRPERMRSYLTDDSLYDRLLRAVYTLRAEWPGSKALPSVPLSEPTRYPLSNVWLGVSAEDQDTFEARHRLLLQTPAAVRWLSLEPLLSPIDIDFSAIDIGLEKDGHGNAAILGGIDWVVAGGESGPKARPMHPAWARAIREQCKAADVPFFFKQWGAWAPTNLSEGWAYDHPDKGRIVFAEGTHDGAGGDRVVMRRFGKKAAGRELDGRTWDEYPGIHG